MRRRQFLNRHANLKEDLVLENSIYLDFDLTNKNYLKAEQRLTKAVLRTLAETKIAIPETDNYLKKILKFIKNRSNRNMKKIIVLKMILLKVLILLLFH